MNFGVPSRSKKKKPKCEQRWGSHVCHLAVGPRAHYKIVFEVSHWHRPDETNAIAEMFHPIKEDLRYSGQLEPCSSADCSSRTMNMTKLNTLLIVNILRQN